METASRNVELKWITHSQYYHFHASVVNGVTVEASFET